MKTKQFLLPLIGVGGITAALFGGGAVQTAFTSTATGTLKAGTASIGTTLADGTVTLANAIPGDTGPTSNITISNKGSTPETISIAFGTGSNPALDALVDVIWNGTDAGPLSTLQSAGSISLDDAVLGAKGSGTDSVTIPVALMLESSADDTVANSSDSVSFTITGTATSTQTPSQDGAPNVNGWDMSTNKTTYDLSQAQTS